MEPTQKPAWRSSTSLLLTCGLPPVPAGISASCASSVIASTTPGDQAALASPNERFVLVLHSQGVLDITDRSTGEALFTVGPFSSCKGPFKLSMLSNGQLVIQGKDGNFAWTSTSACRGNSRCYSYIMQVGSVLLIACPCSSCGLLGGLLLTRPCRSQCQIE
jgi:hypothetical protein